MLQATSKTDNSFGRKIIEEQASGEKHVKLSVYSPPDLTRPTFKTAVSNDFTPTKVGASFGPSWSTHWFRIELTVPENLKHKDHLEFHWDADNEGLIWTEHGEPVHGLTGGGERVEYVLPHGFRDGKLHVFYIEMACNGMFGNAPGGDSIQPPKPDKSYRLKKADIVAVNLEARGLFVDFWIIGGRKIFEIRRDMLIELQMLHVNSRRSRGRRTKLYKYATLLWTRSLRAREVKKPSSNAAR